MCKIPHIRLIAIAATLFALCGGVKVQAQGTGVCGSDPSPAMECGEYQWPLGVIRPCPNVVIKQKGNHYYDDDKQGDHTTTARYRHKGWDTVVSCEHPQIVLSSTPYIPVQRFNGTYYVDQIPYNPPDTTFSQGTRMPIGTDDVFANDHTIIPYAFYFFGIRKNQFRIGANGLVTFCSPTEFGTGNSCPYAFRTNTNKLPWDGSAGHTDPFNQARMRDAIYGVMEDTHPGQFVGSNTNRIDGIFYGILDEYPCRKIICSWKEAPDYGSTSNKATYQIVCYEGSNIIEIHVKRRSCCPTTSDALIGIQNATGQPQVRSTNPTDPNSSSAITGKPAAFAPSVQGGTPGNPFTHTLDYVAYRFTPAGSTAKNYGWRRVFDDGRPDVELRDAFVYPEAMDDTNGYFYPMDDFGTCPTLTRAYVSPKEPAKYVFYLKFRNANNDEYNLTDTIFVGVDTVNYLDLHKLNVDDTLPAKLDVCLNDTARLRLDITTLQEITHEEWLIRRVSGGDTITLDSLVADNTPMNLVNLSNDHLTFDNRYTATPIYRIQGNDTVCLDTTLFSLDDYDRVGDTLMTRKLFLFTNRLPVQGLRANKIDTILVQVTSDFASGCHNYDTMMVRIFPNFDSIIMEGICKGDTFTWDTNGHAYKKYVENTDPQTTWVTLSSAPGCDSTVHLALTVYSVSYTVDHVEDCKPYTWRNGRTYTQGNAATAATDTVILQNRYGCDSIVQLDFVIHPLTAKLRSNVENFTLDNLDAVLTDISIGGASRVWKFPNGPDQTGVNAYYSIPAEMDGANIILIASSEYGCVDTAKIYIPLNKEHFWVPNAFTPDNPAGNSLFSSVSTKTLRQEMLIYNRRGEMVYRCEGVDCAWDGRDMDGNPCVQDAYVYIIRYTNEFEPENTRVLRGTVTLIR